MPKVTRKKKTPPERIYLQWLDPDSHEEAYEVTWCVDQIDRTDPEYVRIDIYEKLLEAAKAMRDELSRYFWDFEGEPRANFWKVMQQSQRVIEGDKDDG